MYNGFTLLTHEMDTILSQLYSNETEHGWGLSEPRRIWEDPRAEWSARLWPNPFHSCPSRLNCVSPERHTQVLTLVLVNMTLLGNRVFATVIKLRWGHEGGPSSNTTGVPVGRGKFWHKKYGEKPGHDRGRYWVQLHAKDWWLPLKPRRSKERGSPTVSGGSVALLTPHIQTSGLLNCERIHFCCFKLHSHPRLRCFVMAAWGILRKDQSRILAYLPFSPKTSAHHLLRPNVSESTDSPFPPHPAASSSPIRARGSTTTQQKIPPPSITSKSHSSPITSCLKSKLPARLPSPPPALCTLSEECDVAPGWLPFPPSPTDLPCSSHNRF